VRIGLGRGSLAQTQRKTEQMCARGIDLKGEKGTRTHTRKSKRRARRTSAGFQETQQFENAEGFQNSQHLQVLVILPILSHVFCNVCAAREGKGLGGQGERERECFGFLRGPFTSTGLLASGG
jgi:hypothetical protein